MKTFNLENVVGLFFNYYYFFKTKQNRKEKKEHGGGNLDIQELNKIFFKQNKTKQKVYIKRRQKYSNSGGQSTHTFP